MCYSQWIRTRTVEGRARGCHHMHVRVDGRGRCTVTCCRASSGCCSPDHVDVVWMLQPRPRGRWAAAGPPGNGAAPAGRAQWVLPQYRVPSGCCRSTEYPVGTAAVLVAQPFGLRRKLQRRFPSVNRRSDSMQRSAAQRSAVSSAVCSAAQCSAVSSAACSAVQ
jgi:hypothetical protein